MILKEDSYRYVNNYGTWDCGEKEGDKNDYTSWIMTEDGLKCIAQLKEEALNKQKLKDELHDLELSQKNKPVDTLKQESILNRIRELKEELGIKPEDQKYR